jgi:hypothetical protein
MPPKRKRNSKVANDPELSDDGGARTTEDAETEINASDCPYLIHFHRPARGTKKPKRSKGGGAVATKKAADNQGGPPPKQDLDKAPIEDNESVYTITPRKKWSSLKKYRQFVGSYCPLLVLHLRSGGLILRKRKRANAIAAIQLATKPSE